MLRVAAAVPRASPVCSWCVSSCLAPTSVLSRRLPQMSSMLAAAAPTGQQRDYAHWYSGRQRRHRLTRDLRFHPRYSVAYMGRNRYSKRLHFKTNRWNYKLAYKDTP